MAIALRASLVSRHVRRGWRKYCNVLDAKPFATKTVTCLIGFGLGDMLAQYQEMSLSRARDPTEAQEFDFARLLRLTLFGGCIAGPRGHYWYGWLDRIVMPKTPTHVNALFIKTFADQVLFAPFGIAMFYGFVRALEGRGNEIVPTVSEQMVPTMIANWKFWPAAHLIVWACILSRMAAGSMKPSSGLGVSQES